MAGHGGTEEPQRHAGSEGRGTKLALISVSDKTGVVAFARGLNKLGFDLLSTGGTASALRDAGLEVTDVSEHTGFPEIMDGRVKTLHPKVHGGLLGRAGEDDALMAELGIPRISLLALNLYPFERVTANPDCTFEDAIENIDIGGPAMLRSAAKNFRSVGVVTDPGQYQGVLSELEQTGELAETTRYRLSVDAFNLVARYDDAISSWLSARTPGESPSAFPGQTNAAFIKAQDLRYGENPHQQAAWYRDPRPAPGTLAAMTQIQGKELSFNNIADADAAWTCARQFETPSCVIVKHANPCGVASAHSALEAYDRAHATDPTSAFGGVIAFNTEVDQETAATVTGRQFVELMIAPAFSPAALEVLSAKQNLRVLVIPIAEMSGGFDARRVGGGMLLQSSDDGMVTQADCRVVSERAPGEQEWNDLLFAWKVAKMVKSNAIVYASDERTLGVGAGQMSRVDSARIGAWKAQDAGLALEGSAMASDAFFPFRDGIDTAAKAGVLAVIQPGGSKRDDEVIAAANEHGMAMVFTGMRHFRH